MDTTVEVAAGALRGNVENGVRSFLGVPYAAAPVGPLRFAAPAPVPAWSGVRDATTLGPTPPQPPYLPPYDHLLTNPLIPGDEFLNVSVWAPEGARDLPVMVWLPGGAFRNGSNAVPIYDGAAFARDGVVLVGVNYRLGALGFAELPDAPSNRGLLDQLAALRWVQDNVAAFGGDPSRVTLFGESAGAISATTLLASPAAKGLFQQVILQSGLATILAEPQDAALLTGVLAERLGVEPTAAALAEVDIATLITEQQAVAVELATKPDPARFGASVVGGGLGIMSFFPVRDESVMPTKPLDGIADGAGADLPLLLGSNTEEFRLFTVPSGAAAATTVETLPAVTARLGIPMELIDAHQAAHPEATPGDAVTVVLTALTFEAAVGGVTKARAGQAPTYGYEFAWPSAVDGLGACHALELPFVFDTLSRDGAEHLTGPNPPQTLADEVHAAWVAFAKGGDPGWQAGSVHRFGP